MSVQIRLFNSIGGFSNYPKSPSEADALISQFKAEANSSSSRVIFSGVYGEIAIRIITNGIFKEPIPGMTLEELQRQNAESLVFDQELYLRGNLAEITEYLVPVTAQSISDSSYKNLSNVYSGNDTIYAPIASERQSGIDFFGYSGNDKFYAYGSHQYDDVFYGGEGLDSLIYSGRIQNYDISGSDTIWNPITEKAESTGYFIRDNTGRDGDVQISEVERIIFSDSAIAFDISGTAGKAYRIYEAVLGRAPDLKGLGYWINDMDNGASLTTIASGFIASKEFQGKYGANPSFETYINLLYQNILGRAPDAEGLNYWVSNMRKGIDSPAAVLASFSEGFENTANVAPDIASGIYYTAWIP